MDFLQELPEQIFRDILLRVPYKSQSNIKQLLEPAKEMMESFQFYQDRIKFGLTKKYICLLLSNKRISMYDPIDESSELLPHIPTNANVHKIINVNHKIVVLDEEDNVIPHFLIYDLLSNTWKCGARIPTHRHRFYPFACCASPDGSIYIAGGYNKYGGNNDHLREAAIYKVDEDKWELLPEMPQEIGNCKGVFIEGMFYVIGIVNNRCQRFDPNTRVWTTITTNMSLPHFGLDILYAFGRLIAFNNEGIMQYDWEGNVWRELEPLPQLFTLFVRATVWCDQIFFCGNTHTLPHSEFYMYKPGPAFPQRWIYVDAPNISRELLVYTLATVEV
ncbi:hypothetical protein SUGI_0694220 [Cryptomeria japonica]|uniref:F-box/kelch-repeat protein At1g80440-like n=1 Tax=Cryptomeria japonica TaxID=3369 RepID=UPI002414B8C7|nr:F-box/kelch-repeat protein At1g80440-like [Cryptomeria japonica]GLJ34522.1 hypothetical protein SUGI_0694220 [Cryptomeria japonica]